jgi:hypothetical protein
LKQLEGAININKIIPHNKDNFVRIQIKASVVGDVILEAEMSMQAFAEAVMHMADRPCAVQLYGVDLKEPQQ